MPRAIREALVSWDRTLYDIPIIEPEKPGPGVLYERIYDLGACLHLSSSPSDRVQAAGSTHAC